MSLSCAAAAGAPSVSPPADGGAPLPEVTVSAATDHSPYTTGSMNTATGLALSIRETPQSVSVVTRQQIEDRNLSTAEAILLSAPGISASRNDSNRITLSARGFVIDNIQFDGLASPVLGLWNYGATNLSSAIYERVEVVRGATGLMTGAGNPSAAVNFIRKRPLPKFFAGTTFSMGRWNQRVLNADISTPLTADGKLSARIVAETAAGDSYVSLLDSRSKTLYGVFTADFTPATRFSGGMEYQENANDGFGSGFPLFFSDGSRTAFDRSVANNTRWSHMGTTSATGFADLTHRFGNRWRLRSAYNHHEGRYDMRQLFRGGYPDRLTGTGMTANFNNYHGNRRRDEIHLALSGPFTLLGRSHEASFGWTRIVDDNHIARHPAAGTLPDTGSFFDWRNGAVAEPAWSAQGLPADNGRVRQTGFYGVGRFSLADSLHVIAGGRAGNWEIDRVYFGSPQQYRYRNELVPYAGVVYDIDDIYSAYAAYTGIFTPQNARSADGTTLPPIRGTSREAGVKAAFFDGDLNGSAAVFQTGQDNLAQPVPGTTVAGLPDVQAYRPAAGATVDGVELELAGRLSAAWNLSASWTRFIAKDAGGTAINTSQPSTLFKLFASYRASEKLTVGGGVDWQNQIGEIAASPSGNVFVTQPGYAIAGVMAQYRLNSHVTISLNVSNLTDKTYYSQIGAFSQGWWGEPRNITATLRAFY